MILSETQNLIRDTARQFAQERIAPFARQWEADGAIPRDVLSEMGRLGFMGMTVPERWAAPEPTPSPTCWRLRRSRQPTVPSRR